MYFKDRKEAGEKLAEQLAPKYRQENSAILSLTNGGVVVASEIAVRLHCGVSMLLTAPIMLPREPDALATVDQEGSMTYNNMFSAGELEEFTGEYHNFIEQEKMEKFHQINHILGAEGMVSRELLRHHNVILVSDGFSSGFSLDAAVQFLKPIQMKRLIVAAPIASVQAIDRMHMLADDVYCLSVLDNYINTNHYYEEQDLPDHEGALEIIRVTALNWR